MCGVRVKRLAKKQMAAHVAQENCPQTFQEHVNTNGQEPRHTLRNTKSQEHVNTALPIQNSRTGHTNCTGSFLIRGEPCVT